MYLYGALANFFCRQLLPTAQSLLFHCQLQPVYFQSYNLEEWKVTLRVELPSLSRERKTAKTEAEAADGNF